MRCDIIGRGGSSDELSVKGLRSMLGLDSNSVYSESREVGEPRSNVCRERTWSSSESSSESDARLPLRARECATSSSDDVTE